MNPLTQVISESDYEINVGEESYKEFFVLIKPVVFKKHALFHECVEDIGHIRYSTVPELGDSTCSLFAEIYTQSRF